MLYIYLGTVVLSLATKAIIEKSAIRKLEKEGYKVEKDPIPFWKRLSVYHFWPVANVFLALFSMFHVKDLQEGYKRLYKNTGRLSKIEDEPDSNDDIGFTPDDIQVTPLVGLDDLPPEFVDVFREMHGDTPPTGSVIIGVRIKAYPGDRMPSSSISVEFVPNFENMTTEERIEFLKKQREIIIESDDFQVHDADSKDEGFDQEPRRLN